MSNTSEAFEKAYINLNPEQKKAVDTVEGPVMVLAGPGTGKTHILTLRIANILKKTQAKPDAILALTFTDSAARTMRHRLANIIGDTSAKKVTITTFHGFAELVRSEYPEIFSLDATKRLMGDVEQVLLMREALDSSDINLLRPAKAPYTYLRDLRSLYEALTRENMSFDAYRTWSKKEMKLLEVDETLKYKRGEKVGEFTKIGLSKLARFDKVEEAIRVFERYQTLKSEHNVMDFADLLSGVICHIRENEDLKSDLQERYQYILADEHQDANALQHTLLELLAYDDHPNLFIVGDEKQGIYRFQGAEIGAFETFKKLFPRTMVITLVSSFRSYQRILDVAHTIVKETDKHQKLSAVRGAGGQILRVVADDPLDEYARVTKLVADSIAQGIAPHEIAIIARTNNTADLFARALVAHGVPVLRAGDLSLTGRPTMRALIALMEYVADPTRLGSLRIALLAPWWKLPTMPLLTLLRTSNDYELTEKLTEAYPKIATVLKNCIAQGLSETPSVCFSYVFFESGARDYLLSHANHIDDIQLVRQLMMHLEEAALNSSASTFAEAFMVLNRAREHNLSPVKVSVTEREGFVTVITAHKAKGMEFRYVFIPDCTESTWEKGGRTTMIPSPFVCKQSLDDSKKLFYVALTRAKDRVYLSYIRENADGRERTPTNFIPADAPEVEVEGETLPILHTSIEASKVVKELTMRYLDSGRLSPSAVNEYLDSPPIFFARRVLRIKEPPQSPLVYGSAMHAALAASLSGASETDAFAVLERTFTQSLLARDAIFEKLRNDARCALKAVLPQLNTFGEPMYIEKAFSLTRKIDGKPVTLGGKIDVAFKIDKGIVVADFKTGSTVSAKNQDHKRQLSLYAQMLSEQGELVTGAMLLKVSEKGIKKVVIPIGKKECEVALKEVDAVVRELRLGIWRKGAPSEYDAILDLCNKK